MPVNRRKLAALLVGLMATAAAAGTAAASHTSTPGVSKHQIVIGGTFPYTGPASLYKTIPLAEQAFYAWVNAKKHGVFGRKIKDITVDDGYNPANTVPAVKQLVEQDHVFAIVGSLGTAPGLATWGYLNQHKVPQVLLATGDAYWGNCVHHACQGSAKPWTMGWQPDYPGEAKLYAKYILKHKPNAKIGVLYQNDAYGKNYLTGLKTGLGTHANEIVDAQSYNVTDSGPVDQQPRHPHREQRRERVRHLRDSERSDHGNGHGRADSRVQSVDVQQQRLGEPPLHAGRGGSTEPSPTESSRAPTSRARRPSRTCRG